ncbi:MAG: thioredoxin domain-containing protein [Polyangiaceae bacterium]|nr:thioredoxin domain-containing protein [Polyangiaceae bacterium]
MIGVRAFVWLIILRAFALVALAASAALYVDYASPVPTFCSSSSGCAQVRYSGYGFVWSWLPVPLVGLLGLGSLLIVALLPKGRLREWLLVPGSLLGALAGIGFILLQVKIGSYCWLCNVVDSSAIGAAVCAVMHRRAERAGGGSVASREPLEVWSWAVLGALAVMAPLVWPRVAPESPVPAPIRELYVPGKINVVEFSDFECPFCRVLHRRMKKLLAEYPGQVHVVRLHVPLASHAYARTAARTAVCAEQQGNREPMADALFEADDLSAAADRELAEAAGLDMQLYDRCIVDPATDARIDRQVQLFANAGLQGLPTCFIGGRSIVGLQPDSVFRQALARAASHEDEGGIPGWLYLCLVGAAAGAALLLGKQRTRRAKGEPVPAA